MRWAIACMFVAAVGCRGAATVDGDGSTRSPEQTDTAPTVANPAPEGGGHVPIDFSDPPENAGTPDPFVDDPDPNTLNQDELFVCDPAAVQASPARVRRLTAAQLEQRWEGLSAPYGPSGQFRYSTDDRDSRIDASVGTLIVKYAMDYGATLADRRIGWPRCMRKDILNGARPDSACLNEWTVEFLHKAWERPATSGEVADQVAFAEQMMDSYGVDEGIEHAAGRPFALSNMYLRIESADELDPSGRERLDHWSIAHALLTAVTNRPLMESRLDKGVDRSLGEAVNALRAAAEGGALNTRDSLAAHARALLFAPLPQDEDDPQISMLPSNIQRFFHEYFGHDQAEFVFKSGGDAPNQPDYKWYKPKEFPRSMDAMIARAYDADTAFLSTLLTTTEYYIPPSDSTELTPWWVYNAEDERPGGFVQMSPAERRGVLTHPAWLVAHSINQPTDPHPIHRGKWVLENLLCGYVPEVPVTVDAQLPEAPDRSVRDRLESITSREANPYCAGCHDMMNPLGLPFEQYSHYGRFRTEEMVGDGSFVPVDSATTLLATQDETLDGLPVADAPALADALAGSDRVEACFVRHTFRYFSGRNETYADGCTLLAMRDAYRDSGGSFREMLLELMTSDTFVYRKPADAGPQETP